MNPPRLTLRGRGILAPSLTPGKPCPRVARLEPWAQEFGPLLTRAPELAGLLAQICIAANMRDTVALARLVHQAESALDSLSWNWGDAAPIINPTPPLA